MGQALIYDYKIKHIKFENVQPSIHLILEGKILFRKFLGSLQKFMPSIIDIIVIIHMKIGNLTQNFLPKFPPLT